MWRLDLEDGPIYAQIVRRVERMLASGSLKPGDKLPSARDLAAELRVNPNTVIHAYAQLELARLTETRRGLGTFVREDVDVAAVRQRLLQAAAGRFWAEVRSLGLGLEEACRAIRAVGEVG